MLRYAHVGYPRAASTWLQFFLFPRHPDLHHFGRHNGDDILDDDLRIALWNDLIARPALLYDSQEVARTFQRLYASAAERKAVACGISQEVLTLFPFVGTVDLFERARRLHLAMGDGTRIIIVVRNQLDWIRSMFCQLLKEGGMPLEWGEFLFYFYYQQDDSPFCTLFFDRVYEAYVDLFGEENVHVIPFELIMRDVSVFAAEICRAIGVSPLFGVPKQSTNERPSAKALSAHLQYNRQNAFYLGSNHFRRPWGFASAPMYHKRFGVDAPAWTTQERVRSLFGFEHMEAAVREAEKKGERIPAMDTTFPATYQELLIKEYAPHNHRLMKLAHVDLRTFGYPL